MAQDFSGGVGGGMKKMQSHMDGLRKPQEKPAQVNQGGGEEKTHTVTEHGDGSHTTRTHDGQEEHHEDHLAALTHLGHHMTGGDKHHMVHHDGMGMHSHGVHEDGSHDGTHDHENLDDLKSSMDQFLGEEGKEGGDGGYGKEEPEPAGAPLGGDVMAIDPAANQKFVEESTVKFVVGSMIWVNRVPFTVVSSSGNTLILKPIGVKIS